jgi:hypothetical protein
VRESGKIERNGGKGVEVGGTRGKLEDERLGFGDSDWTSTLTRGLGHRHSSCVWKCFGRFLAYVSMYTFASLPHFFLLLAVGGLRSTNQAYPLPCH